MDFYTRYQMRGYGEKKHQMVGRTEELVAATLDVLRSKKLLPVSEQERRELAESLLLNTRIINDRYYAESRIPYREPTLLESLQDWWHNLRFYRPRY